MSRLLDDLFISHRLRFDTHHPCLDIVRTGTGPDVRFKQALEPGESLGFGNCPEGFQYKWVSHLPDEAAETFAQDRQSKALKKTNSNVY